MFHELTFRAMNSQIQVLLESEKPIDQLEILIREGFALAEQRFSRFIPSSECSYLNARSGRTSMISDHMVEVLLLSKHYQELTNGAFDICVGHALQQAGYRQSFEMMKENEVTQVQVEQVEPLDSQDTLDVDPRMRSVRFPNHLQLDFGGIVKSWTARQVANQLRKEWQVSRGLLNAGGDVFVWGGSAEREPWRIGIANPYSSDPANEAELHLASGAVATSNTLRRCWHTSSGKMHHLIDTRTMRPSTSSVVQCSVVGIDLVACEVWAKVMCMLGIEDGVRLFRQKAQNMEAILYTSAGDVFQVKSLFSNVSLEWNGLKGVMSL